MTLILRGFLEVPSAAAHYVAAGNLGSMLHLWSSGCRRSPSSSSWTESPCRVIGHCQSAYPAEGSLNPRTLYVTLTLLFGHQGTARFSAGGRCYLQHITAKMQPAAVQGANANAPAGVQIPSAWTQHFQAQDFNPADCRAQLVKHMVDFLCGPRQLAQLLASTHLAEAGLHLIMQLDSHWLADNAKDIHSLMQAGLEAAPKAVLTCLSIAVTEVLLHKQLERTSQLFGTQVVSSHEDCVTVRLTNVAPLVAIRQLRSTLIGQYVSLKGTVVRVSGIRPKVLGMPFICTKCGTKQDQPFEDGKANQPKGCAGQGCKARTFEPCRAEAQYTDWQKIRLQEIVGTDKQQEGQIPRTAEVELAGDLVGCVVAGDVVTVWGEIKVLATGETLGQYDTTGGGGGGAPRSSHGGRGGAKKGKPQQELFLLYLDALSVHNVSRASRVAADRAAAQEALGSSLQQQRPASQTRTAGGSQTSAPNMPAFTQRDMQFINEFTEKFDGDQLRQLVHALCPPIYGQEMVKAGLILALMGGLRKNEGMPGRVPIRGDIHLLLVGDPGLGKSQLLQAAAAAAPRGLYVCGNTSSSAGLTVTVVKDGVTGDYVFEAGAVVLGDRGVCCVDEFDKMQGEHPALLEAMEQQEVSVAKAGMVASLPARTAILAAANPAEGHYNKAKSVADNLKMSPAMLSRFDLIFILLDRPDEVLDQRLSEHVLALHSGQSERAQMAKQRRLQFSDRATDQEQQQQPLLLGSAAHAQEGRGAATRLPLKDRLKLGPAGSHELLPLVLLRKYIAYARQYAMPVLTDDAKQVLLDFYLSLRQQVLAGSSSPITARQLESLARLTEARARVELRHEATREDAEDVVEIMREALYDRFGCLDDVLLGCMDFRPGGAAAGKSKGKAAEAARFLTRLRQLGGRQGRDTFATGELYALATEMNLQVKDISSFLDTLNDVGDLLKAGPGQYRVKGVVPCTPSNSATQAQAFSQGNADFTSKGTQGAGGPRRPSLPKTVKRPIPHPDYVDEAGVLQSQGGDMLMQDAGRGQYSQGSEGVPSQGVPSQGAARRFPQAAGVLANRMGRASHATKQPYGLAQPSQGAAGMIGGTQDAHLGQIGGARVGQYGSQQQASQGINFGQPFF